MTIAPIHARVTDNASAERAFELFATRMGDRWPKGRTLGARPHTQIVIASRAAAGSSATQTGPRRPGET